MHVYQGQNRTLAQGPGASAFPATPGSPTALPATPEVWKEYFCYSADYVGAQAVPAGTANGRPSAIPFAPFNVKIDGDANFEWVRSTYVATDPRLYVRWRDDTAGKYLGRGSGDLQALAAFLSSTIPPGTPPYVGVAPNPIGPSQGPGILPRSYVFAASSLFSTELADYSGVGNTVRVAYHGAKLRAGRAPWMRPYGRRAFYYVAIPDDSVSPAVPLNGTLPFAQSIDNEADFLVYRIVGVRQGPCTIDITDGRDRKWFASAQHFDNVVGNAAFPNILPAPRFVPRGSTLHGVITDLSGATNIVRFYLVGERVYDA